LGALVGAGGATPDAFGWRLVAAMALLLALGAWDDLKPLNPAFRFLVQALAAALAMSAAPRDFAASIAFLPSLVILTGALIAMLWFINLTNFMDGIDLMSVTQFVPAFVAVYVLLMTVVGPPQWVGLLCLASAGALLGFAMLNRPRARLFLGDAGSLPLGLLGAVALLVTWGARGAVAALLPFLYYLADATLTLVRRVLAGEKFWHAHRDHFYQRANRAGMSTWRVIARVAACNVALCALALLVAGRSPGAQAAALAVGVAVVAVLLHDLAGKAA
jgi:UDP-N-acetylmuramyl pentapeptide phosphotransferase/UDP-N-acetylglucosamine-1-phosphate transferase